MENFENILLKDENGNDVKLSDFFGKKIVLYFYPKDDTPGCTAQACSFRDLKTEFEKLNTLILGISRDTPKSHVKFIEKYSLNFPLLSDKEKKLHTFFDVLKEKKMCGKLCQTVERTTVLINEKGEVINIFRGVDAKENALNMLKEINGQK